MIFPGPEVVGLARSSSWGPDVRSTGTSMGGGRGAVPGEQMFVPGEQVFLSLLKAVLNLPGEQMFVLQEPTRPPGTEVIRLAPPVPGEQMFVPQEPAWCYQRLQFPGNRRSGTNCGAPVTLTG